MYYINLDYRTDRDSAMQRELSKIRNIPVFRFGAQKIDNECLMELSEINFLSPCDYINIMSAQTSFATRGSLGCYLSHIELFRKSAEANKIFIVLEDDIEISDHFEDSLLQCIASLDDFNMIYLHQPFRNWMEDSADHNEHVFKIRRSYFCTNGYVIHPRHARFLHDRLHNHYYGHIDNMILHCNVIYNIDNIFLLKKPIIRESALKKDSDVRLRRMRKRSMKFEIPAQLWFVEDQYTDDQIASWRKYHPYFEIHFAKTQEDAMDRIQEKGGFHIGKEIICEYPLDRLIYAMHHVTVHKHPNDFFGSTPEYFHSDHDRQDPKIMVLPEWILTYLHK